MSDDQPGTITFKSHAAISLGLKILLMLLVFIFPFVVVFLLQGYMINLWGEPSLTSPVYLVLLGVLIIWFAAGLTIVVPRVGRRIDARYDPQRERSD
ncbi:MAG: hypothetical protein ACXADO_00875 [Candidatus Thorarchaeota archaeon]|jgi:hypothetical protein